MDVSKFTLDRNAYLNTAAAIYESTKQQVSSNYSAYLDPSVLTKAYFDSKMYTDRATSAASNYAFDITKIYGNQGGGGSQEMSVEREPTPQLDDSNKNMGDTHMDFNGNGAGNYQSFNQQAIKFETEQSNAQSQQQQQQHGAASAGGGGGDYRRPLTVIF
jgi:transcription factor SOX1/3/14/21 (SOX group B)